MALSYKPRTKGFYDPYDKTLLFGNKTARRKGLQLDALSNNKLADIFEDGGPLCFGFGDLDQVQVVHGVVTPSRTIVKTVYVSGVQAENNYVTYCFKPGDNKWVEVEPDIHKPTALVGVLCQEHKRLTDQNRELKDEISSLKLEASLLRHEVERHRPSSPVMKPLKHSTLFLFAFLIGLLFTQSALGFRTGKCLDSDVSDTNRPQTCIMWAWDGGVEPDETVPIMDRLQAWAVGFKIRLVNYFSEENLFVSVLYNYAQLAISWSVVAFMIGIYYTIKAEKPLYMLATLILATFSKVQMFAIAAIPNMEMTSTFSMWISMVMYYFNHIAAIASSMLVGLTCVVVCMFMADSEYIQVVKGHIIVILTMIITHLFHALQIPSWVTIVAIVAFRIVRLLSVVVGEKMEIRSVEGKIIETRPIGHSWINKISRFAQSAFRQKVRVGVSSTARVIPNGVVVVETKETQGTGFRIQNYVTTASHVTGNEEQVKLRWGDVTAYAKVVYRHPTKDLAFIQLPQEFQNLPTYKFAKTVDDGTVVITSIEDCGVLAVAISEGVIVGDNITYAVQTRNGMSGSPVTNVDGRILGLHQTNTGFTGGAVIVKVDDLPPQKKPQKEMELEAKIKELEERLAGQQMAQSLNSDQIVELVRIAVGREINILRHEMSMLQAKGKTKGKRRGGYKKKRKVWTEQEYKELLEKGFTKDQLREMAETLREAEYDDYSDDEEYEAGYPDWSEHEDDEDIEAEWFKNRPKQKILDEVEKGWSGLDFWEQCKGAWADAEPKKEDPVNTLPVHLKDKYGIDCYVISEADVKALASDLKKYQEKVDALIQANTLRGQWLDGIDPKVVLAELEGLWGEINHLMWVNGLIPFTQRRKIKRKPKLESGAQDGPREDQLRIDSWLDMVEPGERYLTPEEYPLIGVAPIDRPICDYDEPVDDLLNLLPAYDEDPPFGPTVWGPEAYSKSFEKFKYREPLTNIKANYPREWGFAMRVLRREYDFLNGSVMIDITSATKNSESTPAYPKSCWWKTEADYLGERGYQDYIREYERIRAGARPKALWYLFLKKEILKTSKIEEGDIRQIICSDPIFARIGCVFEEHQNQLMKGRTLTRMGQCGWSPFCGGFDRRVKRLVGKDNNLFVEFDWTRFDGTIPLEVFKEIKKFRFSCLAKEYRTKNNWDIYTWYCTNIMHRYVMLPSGEITVQNRGNPSGQISTTMDNNMCNVFFQAFEYAYMHPTKTHDDLCSDWEKVDSLIYGDDRLSTFPELPGDYIDKVVKMYADIFGMWVKSDKVKVSNSIIGLSFCGFTITSDGGTYVPVPTEVDKLTAALIKPTKKLQDITSLYGKLLCYRILSHNLPDDNKFKNYILVALEVLARHIRARGGEEPFFVTDEMLDKLWRGGPKRGDGW
ncbi:ORF1ab [Human astrovirus BF34]|uniref:ORF1ab n=1 Tax=Human astrovirus BF34 TaxID=1518575 RepID=UPI0004BDCCC2|nr:ORF1ab [Human astrovirus BF34]AIE45877.1 ORF1ab [Human astrovirus BF34]